MHMTLSLDTYEGRSILALTYIRVAHYLNMLSDGYDMI